VLTQNSQSDDALYRLVADGRASEIATRVLGDPAEVEPAMASLVWTSRSGALLTRQGGGALTAEAGVHTRGRIRSPHCVRDRMRRANASRRTACSMAAAFRRRFSTRRSSTSCVAAFDVVADRRLQIETLYRHYPQHARIRSTVSATDARIGAPSAGRGRAAQRKSPNRDRASFIVRSRGAGAQSDRERRQPASVVPPPAVAPAGSRAPGARRMSAAAPGASAIATRAA